MDSLRQVQSNLHRANQADSHTWWWWWTRTITVYTDSCHSLTPPTAQITVVAIECLNRQSIGEKPHYLWSWRETVLFFYYSYPIINMYIFLNVIFIHILNWILFILFNLSTLKCSRIHFILFVLAFIYFLFSFNDFSTNSVLLYLRTSLYYKYLFLRFFF